MELRISSDYESERGGTIPDDGTGSRTERNSNRQPIATLGEVNRMDKYLDVQGYPSSTHRTIRLETDWIIRGVPSP